MTLLFAHRRTSGYIAVLVLSVVVLGIAAYFAHIFLPRYAADITIFSLIVPSLNILVFAILLYGSQPRIEAFWLFILAVLWLAMGAWYDDLGNHQDCSSITSSIRTATMTGTISARAYCYEMRVVEAFSWMNFVLLTVFLIILITLTGRSEVLGHPYAWQEPVIELPWFGEYPGYPGAYPYGNLHGGQGMMYPPMQMGGMYPQMMGGGYTIQQHPGESVVIQPGVNGGPPMVTQVPG